MSFLAPLAGLLTLGVGASVVVLVYMLRLRRRPVRVSSTLLWARAADEMEGNVPWRAARPGLLMILQLLGVLLLAAALARPVTGGGVGRTGALTLVIDTGASMGSVVDASGATRLDRAKERARALVKGAGGDGSPIRVVRGGASASLVHSGASWREAARLIDELTVEDAPGDLDAALTLAREGAGGDGEASTVLVLSDRGVKPGASVIGVDPESSDRDAVTIRNAGIVALGAQRDNVDPSLVRFFARLGGRSGTEFGGVVRLFVGDEEIASRAVSLEPESDGVLGGDVSLSARVDEAAVVRVTLDGRDALASDNDAWVEIPAPDPVRTLVVAPDAAADALLLDALRAVTRGVVEAVGEGEQGLAGSFDWVVFDRVVPGETPRASSVVFAGAGDAGKAPRRLVTWDRSDPLMRDLELSPLVFVGGAAAPEGARVVARTREDAVIWWGADAGVRHVRVAFALEDSNFGVLVSFPIFLANTLETLVPGVRGSGVTRRVGARVTVRGGDGARVSSAPAGTARLGLAAAGERALLGATRAGVYTVERAEPGLVALSVLDEGVSRRAGTRAAGGDGADPDAAGVLGGGRTELWRVLALAALVVLSAEWVLDAVRRRL